jgi:ABC-2 type transport system permease protein
MMNTRAMLAIVRKDLKVVSQNKNLLIPTLLMMLMIFVIAPWLARLVPLLDKYYDVLSINVNLQDLIDRFPAGLKHELAGYNLSQMIVIFYLVYCLASGFLMVPIFISAGIAADSFAGEKERKTLEALLYSPTTDRELFVAKLLSGWLTSIAFAWVGFLIYVFTVNAAGWSEIGQVFFPNAMWLLLAFWVAPAAPGVVLGLMVLLSTRAQGFQDAYQLGGLVILPVIFLIVGQISGFMFLSASFVFLMGLGIWLLDILLIWLASRSFHRGRLLSGVN